MGCYHSDVRFTLGSGHYSARLKCLLSQKRTFAPRDYSGVRLWVTAQPARYEPDECEFR